MSISDISGNPYSSTPRINSGRPSDLVISHEAPISLERHGSPVAMSDQRATKKACNLKTFENDDPLHEIEATEVDTSMMEVGNESLFVDREVSGTVVNGKTKPSFRDVIAGNMRDQTLRPSIEDLDVKVLEEDVEIVKDGELLEIKFSEKVVSQGIKDRAHVGSEANKDDLYGSWMQVTNRRRKPQTQRDLGAMTRDGAWISSNQQQGDLVRHGSIPKEMTVTVSRNSLPIASTEQVNIVESSLSMGNHVAVQVTAPVDNTNPKVRNGRILPISITGSGGSEGHGISTRMSKKGVRLKKKDVEMFFFKNEN
ncbi:hypothetical protein V6N11_049230 [Hibiscus sabdariffa]|uniref:Uncharacterized protein n=1 Tax=Hibiscus sabdariffa TaxID=183260 RepID=A0ABR2NK61_9ROSI